MTTQATFEPFERKFNIHGNTSAEAFGDKESAIMSARDHGRNEAERVCAGVAADEKIESLQTRAEPAMQPMCTPMGPKATTCSVSFWATCSGQKRIEAQHEICG